MGDILQKKKLKAHLLCLFVCTGGNLKFMLGFASNNGAKTIPWSKSAIRPGDSAARIITFLFLGRFYRINHE